MIKMSLIVARSKNFIIGKNGNIPWHLPEDLKRFKELTIGKVVVMGMNTYKSLGKALPDRLNIVVSSSLDINIVKDGFLVKSISEARELAKRLAYTELFIIGGEKLYEEAFPMCDKLYITEVNECVPINAVDDIAKCTIDIDPSIWLLTMLDARSHSCSPYFFKEYERKRPANFNKPTEHYIDGIHVGHIEADGTVRLVGF